MVSMKKTGGGGGDFRIAYFIIGSLSACLVFIVIAMSVMRLKDTYLMSRKKRQHELIYAKKMGNNIYGQKVVNERADTYSIRSNSNNRTSSRDTRAVAANNGTRPVKLKLKKHRVEDSESVRNSAKPVPASSGGGKAEVDNLYESVRELSTIHYPANETYGMNKSQITTYTLEITQNKPLDTSRVSLNTIINGGSNRNVVLIDGYPNQVDDYEDALSDKFVPAQPEDDSAQRFRIELGDLILNGSYGCVYEGCLFENSKQHSSSSSSSSIGKKTKILIKTTNESASSEHKRALVTKSSLLRGLKHKNLNPLLTISFESNHAPMAVFLNCGLRNLKIHLNQLMATNSIEPEAKRSLTVRETLYMVLQLIKGVT